MTYYGLNTYNSGPPTYNLVTAATERPVTLQELKNWLRIKYSDEDALLTSVINAVTRSAELYTKRDFIRKEYQTFLDYFGDPYQEYGSYGRSFLFNNDNPIELRRTPLNSITHVRYLNTSGTQITIDSADYYVTTTDGSTYSLIQPVPNKNWPSDVEQDRLQVVDIQFFAGWDDATQFQEMWPDLHEAMLAHMADVFTNRGDCSDIKGQCGCAAAPPKARAVYDLYKIVDFAAY